MEELESQELDGDFPGASARKGSTTEHPHEFAQSVRTRIDRELRRGLRETIQRTKAERDK